MKLSKIKETHPNLHKCLEAVIYNGMGGISASGKAIVPPDVDALIVKEKFNAWEQDVSKFAGKVFGNFLNDAKKSEFEDFVDLTYPALEAFACSEESVMDHMAAFCVYGKEISAFFTDYFTDLYA